MTDTTSTFVIPKFRSTRRLIQWVERWNRRTRLPSASEKCFFNDKESPLLKAKNVVRYAEHVGPLEREFEELMVCDPSSIVRYGSVLASGQKTLPDFLEKELVGKDSELYSYAILRSRNPTLYVARLPQYLEDSMEHPDRLTAYARDVIGGRLPEHIEQKIFHQNTKHCPSSMARFVYNYFDVVGKLDLEMELMLLGSVDLTFNYVSKLRRANKEVNPKLYDAMAGNNDALLKLARMEGKRLPKHLEDTLNDPPTCLTYAKEILKGRLPEHLEMVFLKDYRYAYRYAFDVIRGFATVQLPGELHSLMLMKSFENPNDHQIKEYISACEGPEKTQ